MTKTACKIEWITIPAPDLDKAKTFYSSVFGFTLSHFNERFVVFKAGNISGGLDQDLQPANAGIGFSITVENMAETLAQIVAYQGRVLQEPYSLGPGAGFCAQFQDPNGNRLELYADNLGL
jgi:predicted enzyme related to lactoylglutathione lyase